MEQKNEDKASVAVKTNKTEKKTSGGEEISHKSVASKASSTNSSKSKHSNLKEQEVGANPPQQPQQVAISFPEVDPDDISYYMDHHQEYAKKGDKKIAFVIMLYESFREISQTRKKERKVKQGMFFGGIIMSVICFGIVAYLIYTLTSRIFSS